jgi:outer membrane receptor protein involved in Fe transport
MIARHLVFAAARGGCRPAATSSRSTSTSEAIEVVTGGYNAEYGRATGAVVDVRADRRATGVPTTAAAVRPGC